MMLRSGLDFRVEPCVGLPSDSGTAESTRAPTCILKVMNLSSTSPFNYGVYLSTLLPLSLRAGPEESYTLTVLQWPHGGSHRSI